MPISVSYRSFWLLPISTGVEDPAQLTMWVRPHRQELTSFSGSLYYWSLAVITWKQERTRLVIAFQGQNHWGTATWLYMKYPFHRDTREYNCSLIPSKQIRADWITSFSLLSFCAIEWKRRKWKFTGVVESSVAIKTDSLRDTPKHFDTNRGKQGWNAAVSGKLTQYGKF